MQRRRLLGAAASGLATIALPVLAQIERRLRRIGFLSTASASANSSLLGSFRAGMLELRWVEGSDYVIDARYSDGLPQAAANLAEELVATKPDLLLSTAELAVRLLAAKTKTIPIVFALAQDPVGNGLATSLRRPGGNVTGLTSMATELSAKRLQLLKEAFPRIVHVVFLVEPDNAGSVSQVKEAERVAPSLGIRVTPIEVRKPSDIEPAFKHAAAVGVQACIVGQGGISLTLFREIIDRVNSLKIPAMFPDDRFVTSGGLMSYSASTEDNYRRAAAYVDKILKGAKPGDLPIQQPLKFEMVVNMKTAKAIGVTFMETFMLRVDRVIE